jgi:hypothetical protein
VLWEAVAYAALGLLASCAATRLLPLRFPASPLLLTTGPGAGLLGGFVMYAILGGGHTLATLPAAFLTAVCLLSLLARPPKKGRHAKSRPAT